MSLSTTSLESTPRTGWSKIALTAGLLLASILTIVNSVQLSQLAAQNQTSAEDAHVLTLANPIDALEQQVEAIKQLPQAVSEADFVKTRQNMDDRLSHIEQMQATDARSDDVLALQARVADIEARLKQTAQRTAVTHRAVDTAKLQVPEQPFRVIGLELRGGERFLSIAPIGATSLPQVRLLREGEADSGWQLQSIEAHAAVFRVDGQTQRVAVP